jgi:DNA polymerase-3 subunit epsilon
MKLLIFDTETTGLPTSRQPASVGPNIWPHIVSISWVILDGDTNIIEKERSYIINPLGWDIPQESIKIHGITKEKAEAEGHSLSKVLGEFLAEQYDVLVAHNMEFDYNVLYNAIRWDLELPFNTLHKPRICTMELSRNICNLKGMFSKPKAPKLKELYEYTFKRLPVETNLHNSLYDAIILAEVIKHCGELRLKMNLSTIQISRVSNNEGKKNDNRFLSIDLRESDRE